jgi:CRP-like cAMP-binding protein
MSRTRFFTFKGKIKLTVVSDQGKEAVVGMLEPGQFFGEGCLNGQPLRIATTTAIEDCVITPIFLKSREFDDTEIVRVARSKLHDVFSQLCSQCEDWQLTDDERRELARISVRPGVKARE